MQMRTTKSNELNAEKSRLIDSLTEKINLFSSEHCTVNAKQLYSEFEKCCYIKITPPHEKSNNIMAPRCVIVSDTYHARTVKPGNIVLNMRCLIDSLPTIAALTVSIINDILILKICAALSLWKEIINIVTIDITKNQSILIIALWKFRDHTNHISLDYGFKQVNFFCNAIHEKEFIVGMITIVQWMIC